MSWKSRSGMLTANQGAMGLRSKSLSARNRIWRIQSGSPFIHDISETMSGFKPFLGLKMYSSVGSIQPSLYRPRSSSVVAIRSPAQSRSVGDNFSYVDSNKYPFPHHSDATIT